MLYQGLGTSLNRSLKAIANKLRAGSRIFRRGRGPILGVGFGLQHGHFSVKMYAKTKELGPVGGGVRRHAPPPPRSAYETDSQFVSSYDVVVVKD